MLTSNEKHVDFTIKTPLFTDIQAIKFVENLPILQMTELYSTFQPCLAEFSYYCTVRHKTVMHYHLVHIVG